MSKSEDNPTPATARFRADHRPGKPVVLYNVWDAASAVAVARAGASAVATSSWAMAVAQGFQDGERMPLESVVAMTERIVGAVDVPVSVDFEAGYAPSPEGVRSNAEVLIRAGIAGVNLEDRRPGDKDLLDIAVQVERLHAVRAAGQAMHTPIVLNARTDLYFRGPEGPPHETLADEALERAHAYREAGADVLFVPGLNDIRLIGALCEASPLPINVMVNSAESLEALVQAQVARISFGPAGLLAMMGALTASARTVFQAAGGSGAPDTV